MFFSTTLLENFCRNKSFFQRPIPIFQANELRNKPRESNTLLLPSLFHLIDAHPQLLDGFGRLELHWLGRRRRRPSGRRLLLRSTEQPRHDRERGTGSYRSRTRNAEKIVGATGRGSRGRSWKTTTNKRSDLVAAGFDSRSCCPTVLMSPSVRGSRTLVVKNKFRGSGSWLLRIDAQAADRLCRPLRRDRDE